MQKCLSTTQHSLNLKIPESTPTYCIAIGSNELQTMPCCAALCLSHHMRFCGFGVASLRKPSFPTSGDAATKM